MAFTNRAFGNFSESLELNTSGKPFDDVKDMIDELYSLKEQMPSEGMESDLSKITNLKRPRASSCDLEPPIKQLGTSNNEFPRSFQSSYVYTVVQYPAGYNRLVAPNVQKDLNRKNPNDFLKYVTKELTLEQRESLMVDEKQRRKTFLGNWPHNNNDNLSAKSMAKAGFYYLNAADKVQCAFCRVILQAWKPQHHPMVEHGKNYKSCEFVNELPCGNIEFKSVIALDHLHLLTFFSKELRDLIKSNPDDCEMVCAKLDIGLSGAKHLRYATEFKRLETYRQWPPPDFTAGITAQSLCQAGFYYTGPEDGVRCFFCSVFIDKWARDDDPWKEHARYFPTCSFLLVQKGTDYIDQICDLHVQDGPVRTVQENSVSSTVGEERQSGVTRSSALNQTPSSAACCSSVNDGVPEECNKPTSDKELKLPICQGQNCNARADHVGLPCHDLLYCKNCNAKEERNALATGNIPTCKCGASVSATMKVYL